MNESRDFIIEFLDSLCSRTPTVALDGSLRHRPVFHTPKIFCGDWDQIGFQVGFRRTFARWGNSVDFEAAIPQTKEELDNILAEVATLIMCMYPVPASLRIQVPRHTFRWLTVRTFEVANGAVSGSFVQSNWPRSPTPAQIHPLSQWPAGACIFFIAAFVKRSGLVKIKRRRRGDLL